MTRDNAVKLDGYLGDIDNAVKMLQEYQARGESVYVEFNGHKLYSADITLDGAYKEITGQTKAEFDKVQEEWLENYRKEQAEKKEQAEQRIPEWLKRGEKLISADKKEMWEKYVKQSAQSKFYLGADVESALEIMEKIATGASQEEIDKLVHEQGHSGTSYVVVRSMVRDFYGQDIENLEVASKVNEETDKTETEKEDKGRDLISRGEKVIPEDKRKDWAKYVEQSFGGLYEGLTAEAALDIMEKIASGASQEEVDKLVYDQNHSGASYGLVRSVVKEFYGQDFEEIQSIKVEGNKEIKKLPTKDFQDNGAEEFADLTIEELMEIDVRLDEQIEENAKAIQEQERKAIIDRINGKRAKIQQQELQLNELQQQQKVQNSKDSQQH